MDWILQVFNFFGVPKHINFNKYVKCLALSEDKLYCGCSGDSIMVRPSPEDPLSFA